VSGAEGAASKPSRTTGRVSAIGKNGPELAELTPFRLAAGTLPQEAPFPPVGKGAYCGFRFRMPGGRVSPRRACRPP
jgi:hypothetical protein